MAGADLKNGSQCAAHLYGEKYCPRPTPGFHTNQQGGMKANPLPLPGPRTLDVDSEYLKH